MSNYLKTLLEKREEFSSMLEDINKKRIEIENQIKSIDTLVYFADPTIKMLTYPIEKKEDRYPLNATLRQKINFIIQETDYFTNKTIIDYILSKEPFEDEELLRKTVSTYISRMAAEGKIVIHLKDGLKKTFKKQSPRIYAGA